MKYLLLTILFLVAAPVFSDDINSQTGTFQIIEKEEAQNEENGNKREVSSEKKEVKKIEKGDQKGQKLPQKTK